MISLVLISCPAGKCHRLSLNHHHFILAFPKFDSHSLKFYSHFPNFDSHFPGFDCQILIFFPYNVLYELHDCLVFHTQSGYSVRLEGLGTFAPTINRDGGFRLNYRPDKRLVVKLGLDFRGDIRNKQMIGKSSEEFIVRWNEEHPEDPVKT
jgi:hypothetical protein